MLLSSFLALAAAAAPIDLPSAGVVDAPVIGAAPTSIDAVTLPGHVAGARPMSVERIAHATVLFDFNGVRILTDPWFTEAPEYHQGEPLAMAAASLPKLAAIIVSHAHFDHFDVEHFGLRYADKSTLMIVGFEDMVERAHKAGFTNVKRLSPGEKTVVDSVTIESLPGRHVVPEVTYLLKSGGNTVYFGGDTMLAPDVQSIQKLGPVDVACLPVNGLNVKGEPAVMSAEEAAVFAGMLHAAVAIPIHYNFRGGPQTEGTMLTYNGTPQRFLHSLAIDAPATKGVVLLPGQILSLHHEN